MRADIAMDRNGELHEDVENYAREHNVHHAQAYAELLSYGVAHLEECDSVEE